MKTIFVTCFFNLIARNLLETDFFKILIAQPALRIILLVPEKNKNWFANKFAVGNVIIESIQFSKPSKINSLFHLLSWHLLNTKSKFIHKKVQLDKTGNRIVFFVTKLISLLGKSRSLISLFRFFDSKLSAGSGFGYLFEKYTPSLIFSSDIQDLRVQELSDSALIREAKRRGIFSVGMSRSWDSTTTKGLFRTLPDILVVHTDEIKKQAVRYHNVPAGKIFVSGVPHYDAYINEKRSSRESFFDKFSLNPRKKLIFVTPPSDIWTGDKELNPRILKIFSDLGEQTLVRFPIFGDLDLRGYKPASNIVIDTPSHSKNLEEAFLTKADDEHLADSIYNSDVVVTSPSSIILDSIIFDKPTILIGFDSVKKPLWKSLTRYYKYEHQEIIIKRGGLKIANNPDELIDLIRQYLDNPNIGELQRKQVAQSVCDGGSGKKLAQLVLNKI